MRRGLSKLHGRLSAQSFHVFLSLTDRFHRFSESSATIVCGMCETRAPGKVIGRYVTEYLFSQLLGEINCGE